MPHFGMAVICFILFLTFLDNTIISASLSDVQSSLHAGVAQLQWVVSGYALTFASLMLICGTLGDLYGRKRLILIGVALLLRLGAQRPGAVDPGAHRRSGGHGRGSGLLEPGTLSMIRQLYPERRRRARALGIWAAVSGLALAMGPVIGGVLVGLWSWRAVFWFNLLFGLVALIAAAVVLPESSDPVRARLDIPGFVLGALALGAATFATIAGETSGYITWWVLLLYGVAVVAVAAFVPRRAARGEPGAQHPLLPGSRRSPVRPSWRSPRTSASSPSSSSSPSISRSSAPLSPFSLALDFIPMTAGMVLASVFTGRWVSRIGPRVPMTSAACSLRPASSSPTR